MPAQYLASLELPNNPVATGSEPGSSQSHRDQTRQLDAEGSQTAQQGDQPAQHTIDRAARREARALAREVRTGESARV